MTGWTIVTREPEWDDGSRHEQQDLVAYESEIHSTCGQHDSIAGTVDLRLEPLTCSDCADIEIAMRVQAEVDKVADAKHGENPAASARLAGDGRRWSMRRLTPEDKAAEASEPTHPSRSAHRSQRPRG